MHTNKQTNKQRRIYGFWCPEQDFQTVPHMFYVMQIRIIFALPPLGALGSCPSRLPLDPPLQTNKQTNP